MKQDFEIGVSSVDTFWWWITERTDIYIKRQRGVEKPWTDDPILQRYKFTNAFRQLDRGTKALRKLLSRCDDPTWRLWSIVWYRLFNLDVHAETFFASQDDLDSYIINRASRGEQIFTGAHMTMGLPFEPKYVQNLKTARDVWDQRTSLMMYCKEAPMQQMFHRLKEFKCIGPFIAYEMVCDMRFYIHEFPDRNEWANIGPGAKRGMQRLGLEPSLQTMIDLWKQRKKRLPKRTFVADFELREIEHSLCEFDKYERVRLGQGRPRSKYNGTQD